MKTYLLIIVILIFLTRCQSEHATYEKGYANCKNIFDANGGEGRFPDIKCLEGYHLPSFTAVSTQNDTINLNTLLGKPSIINFWFIGCPPCEAEVPGLNQLAIKYNTQANFIAIGRNSDKYLNEFLELNQWNFKHINDPSEFILKNSFKHVWGFPTSLITDKKGKIVKAFSGRKTDSTAVETIIHEIEPTLKKLIAK